MTDSVEKTLQYFNLVIFQERWILSLLEAQKLDSIRVQPERNWKICHDIFIKVIKQQALQGETFFEKLKRVCLLISCYCNFIQVFIMVSTLIFAGVGTWGALQIRYWRTNSIFSRTVNSVMGSGQKILIQVGLGQFFVAWDGLGQPFMVWVWIWKISLKNVNFFNFFHFGSKKSLWVGSKSTLV